MFMRQGGIIMANFDYETSYKRFKKDVNLREIKSIDEFYDEVKQWSRISKGSAKRLGDVFKKMREKELGIGKPRKERAISKAELIPMRMRAKRSWDDAELNLLNREKQKGKGYARRVALQTGRTLASIYKKNSRLKKVRKS